MADRIEQFAVTCPAGTARAAPLEIPTAFHPGELEEIEIVVPDGHAGLTGIALALAHQALVPETAGQFVTSNDEIIHWPVANFPNSGAWSAFVYNTDVFDHTWYVRYLIRELGSNITLSEPTAPGEAVTIGVGQGDLSGGTDSLGGVIDVGDAGPPPDTTDDTPPPDDTGADIPPPDDTTDTTDTTEPADLTAPEDIPAEPVDTTDIPPPEDIPPPPPPPPPPPEIPKYGLPADYSPLPVPIFGNPGNLGMLIGTPLGYKQVDSGSNASGSFNTWRFFSDIGHTYDWNFYLSGAKRLQWVGPFNLREGVPGG